MALLYEKEGRTVTITFNRPEALNAIDMTTAKEFSDALIRFRDDPDAWVGIITGAGDKAFSAGFDLKDVVSGKLDKSMSTMPPTIMRGLDIYKPLIAAINGLAMGGGFETVLACDLRVAAETAVLGLPEVRWSVMPGWGGTQRTPRVIPRAMAAEMLLMGTSMSASDAHRLGLVNRVVPLPEVMPKAKEMAARICENGPLSVWASKEAMVRGNNMSLEDGLELERQLLAQLFTTEDAEEGPKAFAEKRKPNFKAR